MGYIAQPAAAGVYWLGVQALGQTADGRDNTSDGRAAAFIPLLPREADQVRAALVMPIRHSVSYNRNGRLGGIRRWARDLAPGGRLDNLLDFAAAAPPGAVTWLIDPSVLEAVRRIAAGNPPRDLGPVSDESESPSESPEESPSDGATAGSDGNAGVPRDNDARLAGEWLDRVVALTRDDAVLGLPYGDVDMAAANDLDPQVAVRGLAMSASSFQELGIDADPTVAPPSGYLNAISVAGLDNDVTILASDAVLAAPPGKLTENPGAVTVNEHTVHLYDASASLGGPGPNDPLRRPRRPAAPCLRGGAAVDQPQHRPARGLDAGRLEPGPRPSGSLRRPRPLVVVPRAAPVPGSGRPATGRSRRSRLSGAADHRGARRGQLRRCATGCSAPAPRCRAC